MKQNETPKYVHKDSNHPQNILKNISLSVNKGWVPFQLMKKYLTWQVSHTRKPSKKVDTILTLNLTPQLSMKIRETSWGWAVPSSVQAGASFACFDWVQNSWNINFPGLEPQQLMLEPQQLMLEPQQLMLEPQQLMLEPQQLMLSQRK
jgi:hypothetical protein